MLFDHSIDNIQTLRRNHVHSSECRTDEYHGLPSTQGFNTVWRFERDTDFHQFLISVGAKGNPLWEGDRGSDRKQLKFSMLMVNSEFYKGFGVIRVG